jgi:hypothetical protein
VGAPVRYCNECYPQVGKTRQNATAPTRPSGRASKLLGAAKVRAKKRGLEFDLTHGWLKAVLEEGACQVTGLPFDFTTNVGRSMGVRVAPFAPSLDRVDSSKGYVFDNVRVVVACYNLAKNEWPHEVFDRLARAYVSNVCTNGASP